LIAIERDAAYCSKFKNHAGPVIEISPYYRQQILAHPVEATPDFLCPSFTVPLKHAELLIRKGTMVCLVGVFSTKSYHSLWPMVMLYSPGRIEVMPSQVRASASIHRTAKAYLLAKFSFHTLIRVPSWTCHQPSVLAL